MPLDYHLTATWLPLNFHLTTTWLTLDYHLTFTWLPLDYQLTVTLHHLIKLKILIKLHPQLVKNWPKIGALAQILDCKGIPFEYFRRRLSTNENPRFQALDQSQASISGTFYSLTNSKGCHFAWIQPVKAQWKLTGSHEFSEDWVVVT